MSESGQQQTQDITTEGDDDDLKVDTNLSSAPASAPGFLINPVRSLLRGGSLEDQPNEIGTTLEFASFHGVEGSPAISLSSRSSTPSVEGNIDVIPTHNALHRKHGTSENGGIVGDELERERDHYESECYSDSLTEDGGANVDLHAVDSEATRNANGFQSAVNMTDLLGDKFAMHRDALRSELRALKDEAGKRLYSDAEIDAQLTLTTSTAAGSGQEDGLDRAAFGHTATVGYFSMPKTLSPAIDFQDERIPMSNITKWLAGKDKSLGENRKGIAWVHLPVNNLAWVKVCDVPKVLPQNDLQAKIVFKNR